MLYQFDYATDGHILHSGHFINAAHLLISSAVICFILKACVFANNTISLISLYLYRCN